MSKFLDVTVSRSESAIITIEVPDDFNPQTIYHHSHQDRLGEICDECDHSLFWDDMDWQQNIEVNGVKVVERPSDPGEIDGVLEVSKESDESHD